MERFPDQNVTQAILKSLADGPPLTIGELHLTNNHLRWDDFLYALNYLVTNGLLQGKGDGFVVHYSLSSKGKEAILSYRPVMKDGSKESPD